jgi:polar amino acid transport system permease protein
LKANGLKEKSNAARVYTTHSFHPFLIERDFGYHPNCTCFNRHRLDLWNFNWHLELNTFVWVVRGTPLFVQILIVYYALPEVIGLSFTPFTAGVIALGINSTAYISEIVRGGINAIPEGQWEAAYVIGLNPLQILQGIVLPQALRITLPGLTNELTALIKETSILMVIGVAELTKVSKDIVARELDPMTIYLAAALIYLTMTSLASWTTQGLQKRWHL